MTTRVVLGASAVIFALVALMAHLLVGMHDRSSPISLGAPPRLVLDFTSAQVQGDRALATLREVDDRSRLGLAKQSANLNPELSGVLLIPVNDSPLTGGAVRRYEDEPTSVAGTEAWDYLTVNGSYLVTGDQSALPATIAELERLGVTVQREDTTLRDGLGALLRIKGIFLAFLTGAVLLVTLVLYWLAVKSRRRALGVLSGTPVARIQVHDLGQLMLLVILAWVPVSVVAAVAVGLWRGWAFVPVFFRYVVLLGGLMLVVALFAAIVMSAVSIPSPALIARRAPATVGVRRAASTIKVAVFVVVLLMIGPAWVALTQARTQAEQLGRWDRLAHYASFVFTGTGDIDPEDPALQRSFGEMVSEAEDDEALLYSETFYPEEDEPPGPHLEEGAYVYDLLDGSRWAGFSVVNEQWVEVVVGDDTKLLADVPASDLPPAFVDGVEKLPGATFDEASIAGLRYLAPTTRPVPVIGSGGDLDYHDDVLLVVVPDLSSAFRPFILFGGASGGHQLMFEGLDETQRRLEVHGLPKDIKVESAAEAGLLLAQFARYEAWLATASTIGLGVALAVAAAISAYVAMLLQAKNDFVRRLAGQSWLRVLSRRIVPELVIGGLLAIVVLLLQRGHIVPVVVAAVILLAASPLAHILAARRGFSDTALRRL